MHAAGRGGIVNRSTTVSAGPPAFGGGDVWASVHGKSGFAPYMNFRGSSSFRRWDVGNFSSTGIRCECVKREGVLGAILAWADYRPGPGHQRGQEVVNRQQPV